MSLLKKALPNSFSFFLIFTVFILMPKAAYATEQQPVEYVNRVLDTNGEVVENSAHCDDYISISSLGDGDTLLIFPGNNS